MAPRVFVRINAGPRREADALAACRAGAHGLLIPKADGPASLEALGTTLGAEEETLGRTAVVFVAIIEHPAALFEARAIAAVPRVMGLCLGSEDFVAITGGTPSPEVLRHPKLMLHYAAKAEGKLSLGLLRSIADYADLDGLAAAAAEARAHGFDGATCVHPSAVPVLNAAFSPSETERDWARRVLAAAAAHAGPFELDGRMIDAPVIARARKLIDEA